MNESSSGKPRALPQRPHHVTRPRHALTILNQSMIITGTGSNIYHAFRTEALRTAAPERRTGMIRAQVVDLPRPSYISLNEVSGFAYCALLSNSTQITFPFVYLIDSDIVGSYVFTVYCFGTTPSLFDAHSAMTLIDISQQY
jgi:hypothetical protein